MIKNLKKQAFVTFFALFFLALFFSCRTSRNVYKNYSDKKYCADIRIINKIIIEDAEMQKYFSFFNKDVLSFYKDTTISIGFHFLFKYDIAIIRNKEDTTKNLHEIYNDLEQDYYKYEHDKKKVIVTCNQNNLVKEYANLEIKYWYSVNDAVYSVDVVEILKEPGHRQGYIFLIVKDNTDFKIIKRSYWTE